MKTNYKEGTVFAIKLKPKVFVVGVVARVSKPSYLILGYFFNKTYSALPTMEDVGDLEPKKAIKVIRVSDLGIIEKKWPIIGEITKWSRKNWPMPDVYRINILMPEKSWRIRYSEDNIVEQIGEWREPNTANLERDGSDSAAGFLDELKELIL